MDTAGGEGCKHSEVIKIQKERLHWNGKLELFWGKDSGKKKNKS